MGKARNKSIRFIALLLALSTACAAIALPPSHYASRSRLAEGYWVKISVDTTGVYAIGYDRLREWGFGHPENVAVFGTGAVTASDQLFSPSSPDDLTYAPAAHIDGKLVFYAEGDTRATVNNINSMSLKRCYYDFHSYYFLSESAGKNPEMPVEPFNGIIPGQTPETESYAVSVIEHEIHNPLPGGVFFHGPQLHPGDQESFVLNIDGLCANSSTGIPEVFIGYRYAAQRIEESDPNASPVITLDNGWTVKSSMPGTTKRHTDTFNYAMNSGSLTVTGTPQGKYLKVNLSVPSDFAGDYYAIDRVYAIYRQTNRTGDKGWNVLNFFSAHKANPLTIENASGDLVLWDITDTQNTRRLETRQIDGQTYASFPNSFNSVSPGRLLAFSPSAITKEPLFSGIVPNQNLHAMEVPDMLIVTTRTLKEEAENLARIHRTIQGLSVAVAVQDDIFNEFSSGSRMPQAIRRFCKKLHDCDTGNRFRYMLLYGPSLSDNRFIYHTVSDQLTCFQTENETYASSDATNYCSDTYFGMLADNYIHDKIYCQPTQISIGRIPLHSISDARKINEKIKNYLTTPPSAAISVRALFLSDNGDKDSHFKHSRQALELMREGLPEIIPTSVDNLIYPLEKGLAIQGRKKVNEALMRGQTYFWYSGHGSQTSLSVSQLWPLTSVNSTVNTTYPFAVLSTCNTYDFDVRKGSIGERIVTKGDGGAIAAVASGRSVFLDYNRILSHSIAQQIELSAKGDSFADVFYRARNSLMDKTATQDQLGVNILCYNFCGDPAIPVPVQDYTIEIESVGGQTSTAGSVTGVNPLTGTNIKARITDASGQTVPFNGSGILEIYASPYKLVSAIAESDEEQSIMVESDLLAEYPLTVTDGHIDLSFVAPEVTRPDGQNRLILSANSFESNEIAIGQTTISISNTPGDNPVAGAPRIDRMYIGHEDFANGDIVGQGAVFHAFISSSEGDGIVTSPRQIGEAPQCTVDGSIAINPYLSYTWTPEGLLHLTAKLPEIPDGRHTLSLNIGSQSGERTVADLDFTILSTPVTPVLTTDATGTVREKIEFDISGLPEYITDCSLLITDASGTTVLNTQSPVFPFEWDLKDNNGSAVADGVYNACVMARSGNNAGASSRITFTVVKKESAQ